MTGAVGTRCSEGCAVEEPVGLWEDEEIAAAAGEIAIREGAVHEALRSGAVAQFFGAIDGGHAGLLQRGIENGLHCGRIVLQLVIDAGRKINVATADARDGRLWIPESFEGLFDSFLQLRQMQEAGVGACSLHVFGNGDDAVVGGQCDDVVSTADLRIQMREKIAEIFIQPHKNVLDFATARAKLVADIIHRRIANGEKIRSGGFAKI